MMKRFINIALILFLALAPLGCVKSGGGGDNDSAPGAPGATGLDASDVTLNFNFSSMFAMNAPDKDIMLARIVDFITMARSCYAASPYEFITTLYIKVSGSGMSDIVRVLDIADPSSTYSVTLTVPNGSDRNFDVRLKDKNGMVLYSGILDIDVGSNGASQDISISVSLSEEVDAEDYIAIGRAHLENYKLEEAFIAFDTAVSIDTSHPEASFFRGLTHLLLLIQTDDTGLDAASPNVDITSALNLYLNLNDIYQSSIAPDIYDENYDEDVRNFMDKDWAEPEDTTTDTGVNVLESTILPEIDSIISDFGNAAAASGFSTSFTPAMHFEISSEIKVDRGDIYILQAVAYGLKAYLNHSLAYSFRTNVNYWKDEFDKDGVGEPDAQEPYYEGLEYIINNDPGITGGKVFDLTGGAGSYFNTTRSAYSRGLNKLKSALTFMNTTKRNDSDKKEENHIFNLVDINDSVLVEEPDLNKANIAKITETIDQAKSSLTGATDIFFYDDYEDDSIEHDTATLDFSAALSSTTALNRNTIPEFYYHSISDEDMPIFDTNDTGSSSDFIRAFTDVLHKINDNPITTLEDVLREDLTPGDYKFVVPTKTVAMTGDVENDFRGVRPVMPDEEELEDEPWRDIVDVYMTKDANDLYVGIKLRGTPYNPDDLDQNDEWISYTLYFNTEDSSCDWHGSAVAIQLHYYYDGGGTLWHFKLFSGGEEKPEDLLGLGCDYKDKVDGDGIEFKIPLSELKNWINDYQYEAPDVWDGIELFVAVGCYVKVFPPGEAEPEEEGDHVDGCLAELNIPNIP